MTNKSERLGRSIRPRRSLVQILVHGLLALSTGAIVASGARQFWIRQAQRPEATPWSLLQAQRAIDIAHIALWTGGVAVLVSICCAVLLVGFRSEKARQHSSKWLGGFAVVFLTAGFAALAKSQFGPLTEDAVGQTAYLASATVASITIFVVLGYIRWGLFVAGAIIATVLGGTIATEPARTGPSGSTRDWYVAHAESYNAMLSAAAGLPSASDQPDTFAQLCHGIGAAADDLHSAPAAPSSLAADLDAFTNQIHNATATCSDTDDSLNGLAEAFSGEAAHHLDRALSAG